MTDEQIMTAMECCGVKHDCTGCAYFTGSYDCMSVMLKDALDLIKRQKAVVEQAKQFMADMTAFANMFDDIPEVYDIDADTIRKLLEEKSDDNSGHEIGVAH